MRYTGLLPFAVLALIMSAGLASAAVKGPADCSHGKRACLQLGDTLETCDARWKACMQTGCWISGLVKRCGYAKH